MIRTATEEDLSAIDEIYNQAVSLGFRTAHLEPLTRQERTEWFNGHDEKSYPVYVYETDDRVVGWISLSPYRPGREALEEVAEISFYVDSNHQNRGIGSELLKLGLRKAPGLNKRVYFAIVIEGNAGSVRLLEKYGFEQWGYLPEVINYNGEKRGQIYFGMVVDGEERLSFLF